MRNRNMCGEHVMKNKSLYLLNGNCCALTAWDTANAQRKGVNHKKGFHHVKRI